MFSVTSLSSTFPLLPLDLNPKFAFPESKPTLRGGRRVNHMPPRKVLVGTFQQPIILYVFSEGCGTKGPSKDGWMEKTVETPIVGLHAVENSHQ